MIPVDFFGCAKEEIARCSREEACACFPFTGFTFPNAAALSSLSEALTGRRAFSIRPVPLAVEPFHELSEDLQNVVWVASTEALMDAGARWARLPPWQELDTNPMDLSGFLLVLQSIMHGPHGRKNSIFLLAEAGDLPLS